MDQNKPQRLSEVVNCFAAQGANDARWFLFEHQLEQVKISAQTVVGTLKQIGDKPENEAEREAAQDCLDYCTMMLTAVLGCRASCHAYLSGTSVPEKISRKEV